MLWGLLPLVLVVPLLVVLPSEVAAQTTATLSISAPADAAEDDSGTRNLFFTVTLSTAVHGGTTDYQVCFTGTATIHTASSQVFSAPYPDIPANSDYQAVLALAGGTFAVWNQNCVTGSFGIGETTESVVGIRVKGDTDAEADETVTATLSLGDSNPGGVTLGTSTATHTILDDDTPPVISVALPISEGESRSDAGEKKVAESESGVGIGFALSADQPLPAALTVCVRVTESGGDRVASGDEGIQTVNMPMSLTNGSGTHTLTWTNTAADDQDSSVTVEAVPPNTNGCSATAGSYTVSTADGSDKVLIQDDEDTTVSLASTDMTMTEGDATDTAVLTVSLDRRLYAGETIVVPIALATTTGARLPGSVDGSTVANHDFTVSAAAGSGHHGVTLANASTANPRVVFTSHDTNTVQTATVTLTPVANRDDGDATNETITATLASLGLIDTTVSGGVTAHSANNAATLTLEDDEAAPPGTPGMTFRSVGDGTVLSRTSPLRLTENGFTQYTIVLDAEPTQDVRVTVSGSSVGLGASADAHAVTTSPHQLTFTPSNWNQPQTVTVTGVDEPNRHRDRTLWVTNGANSTDTRYENLSSAPIRTWVHDAPEVEVFAHVRYDDENAWRWFVNGNGGMLRPSTITAAPGITPMRNVTPCCEVQYAVRLSNKPLGGPVTVDISVNDLGGTTASNITGISLTRGGTPQQSLSITFEERAPAPGCGRLVQQDGTYWDSNGWLRYGVSDSYDNNAHTSWECYRFIWVHNKREHQKPTRSLCADITHTATGGGVRKVTVDTIRMHSLGFNSGRVHYNPACPFLYANTLGTPQNSPQPVQAAPVPTTAIANLSVADSGGTTATAAWDAVPHADKYSVSYSAQAADGSLTQTAGAFDDITATSLTFDHGIAAPAAVTVTVTPSYDSDGGGAPAVTYLDSLAATATLNTGATPDQSATAVEDETPDEDGPAAPPPGCVSDDTLELARDYYDLNKYRSPGYGRNWQRVLIAFGDVSDSKLSPFTAAEASQSETR